MSKAKYSIGVVLMGISLIGILIVTLVISGIFIIRMRSLTNEQIETITREQVAGITDSLIRVFNAHEQALYQTAAGIDLLYEHSGEAALTAEAVSIEEMRMFFSRIQDTMDDVAQVFMANNTPTFETDGYAVFFPVWNFPGDYDQRTRPWFTGAKAKAGAVSYTDPYLAMATGIVSTSLSTVIYGKNKRDLGVIVMDIAVSSLTDIVNFAKDVEGLDTWLLNKDGLYISNKNRDAVMKLNFFEDQGLKEYKEQVLNTRSFYAMGKDRIICSSIIPGAEWVVVSTIPQQLVFAGVNHAIFTTAIFAAIMIILLSVILALAIHRISKPIVTIAQTLKDISEGEGDLTRQINVNADNEIGDLARYFNQTLEKIRNLIITIKQQSACLFDIGNELAGNMAETAAAINQIAANIQSIKARVINQSAGVTETNATMERITDNINRLNTHIENQSSSVSQSSSAIEKMLANILSVTHTLVKNMDNVNALSEASGVGHEGLQEVAGNIREIARESEGLLEINSVMENIASQTNLLSMNAAIEAAHAGEAGKGFAVVADEIRKLAENSGEQSKTISTVLKKIKGSIDKITVSTDNVLKNFEAIDEGVRIVSDQEENIRNAMEEQGAGSKQILDAVARLNEITQQVKSGSLEMLEGSKEVIQESNNLELVTQEITGGMNEMAGGAAQINIAVNRVNEICGKNKDNIDILVREVSRFKVE
ncbi:MAG: methyl-accepting chemotaxis protein [Treponema sp.]|jgi:methyl-accepting chemotaxis protein|nr:methyl-accepting chemotaxis protein [Treponema sp.]